MYLSFNARALGVTDLSPEETLAMEAGAGFGRVDLPVRDLVDSGSDPVAHRAKVEELNLRGGAFSLPMNRRGSSSDFARDPGRFPGCAESAAVLGLKRTGTWVMPDTPERPDGAEARQAHLSETVAEHVDRLGAVARVLDARGIRIGPAVIGVSSSRTGRGLPFVHRMADLDRVLGAVWHEAPNFGVLMDVFHSTRPGRPSRRRWRGV